MTTPHIEEINYETRDYDGIRWIRYDHYEHALTQAHKAGRDEAVEVIKKQTRYNMESDGACGDPECCGIPSYDMWESDDGEYLKRDDTIKALQDNK